MPDNTSTPDVGGSLTNILSGLQNGVIALNNLNKAINAITTTTISTAAGTTITTIRLTSISS